jgi:hypothetical protein
MFAPGSGSDLRNDIALVFLGRASSYAPVELDWGADASSSVGSAVSAMGAHVHVRVLNWR